MESELHRPSRFQRAHKHFVAEKPVHRSPITAGRSKPQVNLSWCMRDKATEALRCDLRRADAINMKFRAPRAAASAVFLALAMQSVGRKVPGNSEMEMS